MRPIYLSLTAIVMFGLSVSVISTLVYATSGYLANAGISSTEKMVQIDGGRYTPLYKQDDQAKQVAVEAFYLDKYQVTNQEYWAYLATHPKWQRDKVSSIFADQGYLSHLNATTVDALGNQPVTHVSWFAAMAYCKAKGKSLPNLDQWEYAAQASANSPNGTDNAEYRQKILSWYAKPATTALPEVQDTEENYWGVYGMHGVVWEQVSDFNTILVSGESRGDSALDKQLFCGSGAAQSVDPNDYAAFMRYALRGSYSAEYTLATMGFRCAVNIDPISNIVSLNRS